MIPPSQRGDAHDRVERALLGALMIVGSIDLVPQLRAQHFRSHYRGLVYSAILKLSFLQKPIDSITVAHELERAGGTPPHGIARWSLAVDELLDWALVGSPDDESIQEYAAIILEDFHRRRVTELRENA